MPRGGARPGAGRKPKPSGPPKSKVAAPVGRPSSYDPAFCDDVERLMAEGYSLGAVAGKLRIARSTINDWIEKHPEFADAVSRAKGARLVHWEDAAMRVAKTGGGPGTATIIVFGLKNMGGGDWTDKQVHEHSGPDGAPIAAAIQVSIIPTPEGFFFDADGKLTKPEEEP